jgi:preprotein translocase subunit SecA
MLKKFVRIIGGDPNKRAVDKYADFVSVINDLEEEFDEEHLSEAGLLAKTAEFRARLAGGETLDDILAEAFAAVREASKRTIGLRHFDVQLIGGIALHQGKIAEMRTGEGKTLVATLPLYLNALTGRGVHLVTVNDYLARRDARWMGPIYNALGMSVGVLQMAARTENGKKAFLVDLERESPHEDQDRLRMVSRGEAYAADILYGTNSEFGFDYLRDNMAMSLDERVQRGHYYAIVDEVDNVLIDEARTPLIISGPAHEDTEWYVRMAQVVKRLREEDYEIDERNRSISLTEFGEAHVEELLEIPLRDPERPEDVTPEQARLLGFLEQALRAQYLFKRNKDYLVIGGKVIIVDEFTGRQMPGRRWSDGLHQAVEAKEGARVQAENVTYATITIQNYFRMYEKLAGMTGTALTEAEEFDKIYTLEVIAIPTNLEYQAIGPLAILVELDGRDEFGYKYNYYGQNGDEEQNPVFWKRKDYPDVIYRTEEAKFRAITQEILRYNAQGRPMLVGTTSVELSERLANRLRAEPLHRLAQVLLLRHSWLEKNQRVEDGRLIPELEPLYAPLDQLPLSEMRKMANELGISFNPEDPDSLKRLASILYLEEGDQRRLLACLKSGIQSQVLNARKHTEESQIIAGAGAFGSITIATNMAGRGVDIKLGGELPEDILSYINQLLRSAGVKDPYSMVNTTRLEALQAVILKEFELAPEINPNGFRLADPGLLSKSKDLLLQKAAAGLIRDEWETLASFLYRSGKYSLMGAQRVASFWGHVEKEMQVRALGGLHVIGSERHEARRIDNQLRGRSARQGDPGSSRFYLSLEDELMRRFGGEQVDNVMQRFRVDDAMPMEFNLVGRIVEQSQTRVEGANFDIRKHLLEYDDVLNAQRKRIYEQRDRIFTKDDLSEDVTEMLRAEVTRRVPEAFKDPEGPWKLLAWLDQIQPTLQLDRALFPSFTNKLLLDHLMAREEVLQNPLPALLELASEALKAEAEHHLHSIDLLMTQAQSRLEGQLNERSEALETFFSGLKDRDEEEGTPNPRELMDEIAGLLHMPVKLTPEQQRLLKGDSNQDELRQLEDDLHLQLETALTNQSLARLGGLIERRLDESLGINPSQLPHGDWDEIRDQVTQAARSVLESRYLRLIGEAATQGTLPTDGQIAKDLIVSLERTQSPLAPAHLLNLITLMPQGARASFDKRTHRRTLERTTRLTYFFFAAQLLQDRSGEEIAEEVLEHLVQAQTAMRRFWGAAEWARLSAATPAELDARTQNGLRGALGEERYAQVQDHPLQSLREEDALKVIDQLGRRIQTEVYRPLLLGVTTELWVDYLTQMEALRVSIGLEAYAQRDPLVQYKSRASELFQDLFGNMRIGVVTRMFTYRPRNLSSLQLAEKRLPEVEAAGDDTKALPVDVADYDEVLPLLDEGERGPEAEATAHLAQPENGDQVGASAATSQSGLSKSQKRRRGRR